MKKIIVLLFSLVFLPAGVAYAACGNLANPCASITLSADNTVVNCILDDSPGTCMVDLTDVLTQLNNNTTLKTANITVFESTPMVVQAWGGNGGNGSGTLNGDGAAGGYAQTTTSVKDLNALNFSTQLFFYKGGGGVSTGTKHCGGGGGASTAVSLFDLSLNPTTRPNLGELLLIAGGGGGGGAMDYSGFCNLGIGVPGGPGGAGGIAIATQGAAANADGDPSSSYDGSCSSDSGGNYDGKGSGGAGGGGGDGASGVGAWGGTGGDGSGCYPSYYATWVNSANPFGYEGPDSGGGGNSATSSCDAGGGAGGGGYGGGSGGRHANDAQISCGGGGGGSYAVKSTLAGGPAARPSNPFGNNGGVALQFLIDSAETPTVTQGLNAKSFQPGDTLSVHVSVKKIASQTEFYMGGLLPDSHTMFFVTVLDPLTLIEGDLNDPKTFRPVSDRTFIPNGVAAAFPNLFSYTFTSVEPDGEYLFFSALAHPGAFADGSIDAGDFISIDTDAFHVGTKEALDRQHEFGE